ncbi:putative peptidoglycan hydrolase [Pseudomonas sp. StFLB209]|uniref:hypothetical protein n=1 Tax=Pseudomonas sp. StFLB209 TaxID=1028989 RepID=UPI0004F6206A|nr:hypothetical protein [Pseudomonas sp. StFLB209]BAP42154.1 putative peptidoglycan hydrolase [Pseudomonas sp. StFLB209]
MDEQANLHALPDFLRAELSGHVGNIASLTPLQRVARYRASAEQLIANKRAGLQQEHVNHAQSVHFLSTVRYTKEDLELSNRLRSMPGIRPTDLDSMAIDAIFFLESNRHLMEFIAGLGQLEAHLAEQERLRAQQQAQEAARLHTQRLAEETARRLQAEEAARKLAQQKAEQEALRATTVAILPASSIELTFGPQATADVTTAIATLKSSIDQAITVFSETLRPHAAHLQDPNVQNLLELSGAERN